MIDTTNVTIPVGESVLGRVLNAYGEPIDGGPPLVDAPREPLHYDGRSVQPHAGVPQMLHTEIKVVDLFAPLVRGGIAEVIAGAGVGKLVLLQELIEATARHGGHAVCLGLEERTHTTNGLMLEMRGAGVDHSLTMVFAQRGDDHREHEQVIAAGLTIAEYFRDRGEDVLLLADRQLVLHQLDSLRSRVGTTATGAITAIVFDMMHEDGSSTTTSDAVDSRLVFSAALAKQRLYPAVDPLKSASQLLDSKYVGAQHVAVAHQARDLLARYAELHDAVETNGLESLASDDRSVAVRARRIQRFLTQPFVVAEPWTGQPGEQVALADTIAGVSAILAGRYDDVPEDDLRFIGVLTGATP
jgi:F-type H+-transporting ATPase subunit beta